MKITCKNGDILEGTDEELARYQLIKMRQQQLQPSYKHGVILIPSDLVSDFETVNKLVAELVAKGALSKYYS